MTKPDWAERLQRTFKRKYDLGYDQGFSDGSKKALHEARRVFVKTIQKEIKDVSTMVDKEYINGLERAIDIIRKGK
jgi:flagellar biosynthesis/type III secretory pathway protein FliH